MTVTSTNQKVQFNGNGSTTVFAYNFKIFAQTDLSVILRSAAGTETVQQLTTNYTVSGVGEASGGNVTMGTAPPSGTTLTILRVQPNLQGLDLVPNDPFPAGSMEDALDKLTFMVQTHDEEIGRSIKASKTNVIADSEFTVSAADRANKLFSFDSSGNLSIAQELGTYKGNWAASTTYAVRDLVKDTSTGNIFICVTAHTSSGSQPLTTNTDAAKWALIVDAASATTSQNAAAASATASANSATASASSASTSSTKADEAAASASTASTKAGEAASSATAAASSATSAASTLTTFQQQYHGAASSDPTSNLTEGDLYFKTGSGGGLRVYNGSAWVTAAFDVSGALLAANNLSDVASAATALTNLGVTSTAAELNKLDALSRGSLIYGNASAATAVLTKGSANTFLRSDGTDIAWATVSTGTAAIVFPSNWASPTNNYTSSGTWSKGSLADDDYVWFYLVNSGGGGGNARPGYGGQAMLLYGTAATFNGAAYTIGAAKAGASSTGGTAQNPTTVTLSSGNGSIAFTPADLTSANDVSGASSLQTNIRSIDGGVLGTYLIGAPAASYAINTGTLPSGYGRWTISESINDYLGGDTDSVFAGGAGFTTFSSVNTNAVSLFSGNGGASNGAAGTAPGGGGAETNGGTGASGAAGSVRVYHV